MNPLRYSAVAVSILVLTLSANAMALVTLNFDPVGTPGGGDLPAGITAMGNSPGATVPVGAELTNQYGSTAGVLFSSTDPFIAVVSGADNSPNAIGGVTSGGLLSYADPVIMTFVVPGTSTAGITSNVSIQADPQGIPGQFATLSAFDINGTLIDQQTLEDVGSEIWTLDVAGIHSVRFNFPTTDTGALTTGSAFGSGTGIALDNLTFGTVVAAGESGPTNPTAVPLPRMVWSSLMLLGALAGVHVLRRRTSAV